MVVTWYLHDTYSVSVVLYVASATIEGSCTEVYRLSRRIHQQKTNNAGLTRMLLYDATIYETQYLLGCPEIQPAKFLVSFEETFQQNSDRSICWWANNDQLCVHFCVHLTQTSLPLWLYILYGWTHNILCVNRTVSVCTCTDLCFLYAFVWLSVPV